MVHVNTDSESSELGNPARLLQLVMDNIPQFIFWKDRQSVYLGCNQNFAEAAGVSDPSDIVGKTDFDLAWKREEAEFFRQVDQRVMTSGKAEYHIIEPQLQADGKHAWLETNKVPLFDGEGQVVGILGTFEDITQRILAEQALREREQNLRVTLNAIAEGVIATDSNGNITRINPVAVALLGSPADAIGAPLASVYLPRAIAGDNAEGAPAGETRDALALVRQTLSPQRSPLLSLPTAAGRTLEVTETASPILNDAGALIGMVVVFSDISAQRRVEAQLRHSQKMDSIGQLAGGIAHDFNNMLSGIISASDLIYLKTAEPSTRQLASMILHSAQRAAELTAKLLSFSRRAHWQNRPLDVHRAVRDVVGILQRSVSRDITLTLQLEAESSGVLGDPAEFETTILNLAINARDAMKDRGGALLIRSVNTVLDSEDCARSPFELSPGLYLQLTVEDTGMGISPEDLPRIFEPFFTTKPVGEGTGLGLSAVYGVVQAHRGSVQVSSAPGEGTVFTLLLPVHGEEVREVSVNPQRLPRGDGKAVLVVDDEEVLRSMASILLEQLGYRVYLAADGQQAVELYSEKGSDIDCVLLDVIMPRKNGHETFLELQEMNPGVRVLMTSGFTQEAVLEKLEQQGVRGFLKKPYRRSELAQAIADALDLEPIPPSVTT
ncbi:MAG: hypothetical protein RJA70_1873 [Pseudomonadota bacterium]